MAQAANGDPLVLGNTSNSATSETRLDVLGATVGTALRVTNTLGGGIEGRCWSGAATGVHGSSSRGPGVQGESDQGPGTQGVSNSGYGVEGVSSFAAGVVGSSTQGVGVYGSSASGYGVLGTSRDAPALSGSSTNSVGVFGHSDASYGVLGTSSAVAGLAGDARNAYGVYGNSVSNAGVYGQSQSGPGVSGYSETAQGIRGQTGRGVGVYGVASDPVGYAGHFDGAVVVSGAFTVIGGAKSAAVPHPDGSHRRLYCLESPEAYFEDFGRAMLTAGRASVRLDPDFAAVVGVADYDVFLTEYGDSRGLYVAERSAERFVVQEKQGGTTNVAFSYRVVARRRDIASPRLARVNLPAVARAPADRPAAPADGLKRPAPPAPRPQPDATPPPKR